MSKLFALVTGSTGFIGSHLAGKLASEGWQVHVIVRPNTSLSPLETIRGAISVHTHDGGQESLHSIFEEVRPSVVFHLASLFLATHRPDDVRPLVESNILFGAQLLEAMTRTGCNKLVNTGTSWQHYHSDDYVPVCLYAATKQAFEDLAWYYVQAEGLRLITLKLFDTYGPRDLRPKLFNALRNAATRGEELAMSAGEQLVDLVYVDDVARAFLVAAEMLLEGKGTAPEAYAISCGKPRPLREIVETYARVTGVPLRVKWGARPYRAREVMTPWTAGKQLPSWTPEVSLEEGIRKMERLMIGQVTG